MARIAGVDLPRTKRVEIGLTYIYGIGRTRSNGILKVAGVNPDTRVQNLSEDDANEILVACGEACANVVQHAYSGAPGEMEQDPLVNTATVTAQDIDGAAVTQGVDTHSTDILMQVYLTILRSP